MITTILAEKPSQALNYKNALENHYKIKFNKEEGCYISDKFIITYAYGHLIELAKDDEYRKEGYWSLDYLPLFPKKFKYVISKDYKTKKTDYGKEKQIKIINNCFQKSDIIINGTDADREGELIFNYIYNYLESNKPVKRLWLNSLTENEIIKGLENLQNPNKYFIESAYLRAILDWIIGVNGTQAATLKIGNGNTLTIGRVQTIILKLICEKYLKNINFNTTYSYKIVTNHKINNINFTSETENFESFSVASDYKNQLNTYHIVNKINKTQSKETPPLLYSINTLIIDSNKYLSNKPEETLNIAQKLYEKKLISYPRTDNEYINKENYLFINKYFNKLLDYFDLENIQLNENPKSVNDKKVDSSHDALIPTGEINSLDKLSSQELDLYKLILYKSMQSFSTEDFEIEKTTISYSNKVNFITRNTKILNLGWKKHLWNTINKTEPIPQLENEQNIEILNSELKKIEASPPKLANTENLTNELSNAYKLIEENNIQIPTNFNIKEVEIGTQSTRALIIKRLEELKFIKYKNKSYVPTELGLNYYQAIKNLKVSDYLFTIETEINLYKIFKNEINRNEFLLNLEILTNNIVNNIISLDNKITKSSTKEELGICPKCKKGQIIKHKKGFGCTEYNKTKCDFRFYLSYNGKDITKKMAEEIVNKGKTSSVTFKSKNGNPYKGILKINNEFKIIMEYENQF